MKYRVRVLWDKPMPYDFATYFRTKKEAVEYQKTLNRPSVVERKLVTDWYPYE